MNQTPHPRRRTEVTTCTMLRSSKSAFTSISANTVRSTIIYVIMVALPCAGATAQQRDLKATYLNPKASISERTADLLARMTLTEKIAQLRCTTRKVVWDQNLTVEGIGGVGPIFRSWTAGEAAARINEVQKLAVEKTRLGIPVIFHDEALHGLIANKATSFPQAIGLAATWDPALMQRVGTAIGKESRARGIRQVLSPVVNIARDVRWGRVGETYGEDPLLQSAMGTAFCSGIEQEGVITTPKHFVANYGDGGRDSYPVFLSERELREVYFPPFKACIQNGGARSVMASYNALNDVPCSADPWLLTDILRKEWGFRGFVVSDYGSVAGIREKHGVTATMRETAAKAVEAGMDMELPDIRYYGDPLVEAAKEGSVSAEAVNRATASILRAKFELGLFERPYADTTRADAINDAPAHRALAREAAQRAIVLLKNDPQVLPLRKDIARIAVIGPCADSVLLGDYSGFGMDVVTLRQGIAAALPKSATVVYEKGCDVGFNALPMIPAENLVPAGGPPGAKGLRGEYYRQHDLLRRTPPRPDRSRHTVHLGHGVPRFNDSERAVLHPLDRFARPLHVRRVPPRRKHRRRCAALAGRQTPDRAVVRPRRHARCGRHPSRSRTCL